VVCATAAPGAAPGRQAARAATEARLARDLDRDGVRRPHAGIERRRATRTAQEHGRRDQQDRRRAHLESHEDVAGASGTRAAGSLPAHRADKLDAGGLQGHEPDVSDIRRHPRGDHFDDRHEHRPRDRVPRRGCRECHQEALREELPHDPPACGAERHLDANLALPCQALRQEEVRHVGAGDQQDEAERDEEGRGDRHRVEGLLDRAAAGYERDTGGGRVVRDAGRPTGLPRGELRRRGVQ
jgi:hypothetical protein